MLWCEIRVDNREPPFTIDDSPPGYGARAHAFLSSHPSSLPAENPADLTSRSWRTSECRDLSVRRDPAARNARHDRGHARRKGSASPHGAIDRCGDRSDVQRVAPGVTSGRCPAAQHVPAHPGVAQWPRWNGATGRSIFPLSPARLAHRPLQT